MVGNFEQIKGKLPLNLCTIRVLCTSSIIKRYLSQAQSTKVLLFITLTLIDLKIFNNLLIIKIIILFQWLEITTILLEEPKYEA